MVQITNIKTDMFFQGEFTAVSVVQNLNAVLAMLKVEIMLRGLVPDISKIRKAAE